MFLNDMVTQMTHPVPSCKIPRTIAWYTLGATQSKLGHLHDQDEIFVSFFAVVSFSHALQIPFNQFH